MVYNKTLLNAIGLALVIVFLIWILSDIVIFGTIALILTTILRIPTNYLSQTHLLGVKMPQFLAIMISFGILAGIIFIFILIFKPLVSEQIKVVAAIDYEGLLDELVKPLKPFEDMMIENRMVHAHKGFIVETIKEKIFSAIGKLQLSDILNNIISTTGNFFVGILAVLFITFFLLFEKGLLRRNLIALIPNAYFEVSIGVFYKVEKLLSNYLLGLLLQMLSIFTLISFGLLVLGFKYAITIGLFAASVHLIPFVGPITATIFGLIVIFSTSSSLHLDNAQYWLIFKGIAVFGTVYFIDNILLQPLIYSKSVKAHPLEIFISIFVGATLAGAVGMVAAIPTYTVIKVSFVELYRGYQKYYIFRNVKTN